jgi:hypothetical protein
VAGVALYDKLIEKLKNGRDMVIETSSNLLAPESIGSRRG